ncbi:hypothetical protein FQR65_LT20629 [Abscondita terminalis]|nr:hypothetical protein FQR65_LT20629 [Abscondita terminalis]
MTEPLIPRTAEISVDNPEKLVSRNGILRSPVRCTGFSEDVETQLWSQEDQRGRTNATTSTEAEAFSSTQNTTAWRASRGTLGVDREDEMVAALDFCLHGRGGSAPSIDTAMHGLVNAAHVDHLHPDSGIAIATAADGEKLTTQIFGEKVVWVPWRRPGFQLGLDIAAIKEANPEA